MLVSEWDVNIQFDCANVCMIDMKTCFFRQEDIKQIEEKAISSGGLWPPQHHIRYNSLVIVRLALLHVIVKAMPNYAATKKWAGLTL